MPFLNAKPGIFEEDRAVERTLPCRAGLCTASKKSIVYESFKLRGVLDEKTESLVFVDSFRKGRKTATGFLLFYRITH